MSKKCSARGVVVWGQVMQNALQVKCDAGYFMDLLRADFVD